jgi:hypothetical protein
MRGTGDEEIVNKNLPEIALFFNKISGFRLLVYWVTSEQLPLICLY